MVKKQETQLTDGPVSSKENEPSGNIENARSRKSSRLSRLKGMKSKKPIPPSKAEIDRVWQEGSIPIQITPRRGSPDLIEWASANKTYIQEQLDTTGAVLFRGFRLNGPNEFQRFIRQAISPSLLEYRNRSTPRTRVDKQIFTSTVYPADQSIPLHSEMAYSNFWPGKLLFYSMKAADEGGHTPIADIGKIYKRLSPSIVKDFGEKGVMYVRNYGKMDLPWQDVFQTENKAELESFCKRMGMEFEWLGEDHLRTRHICQGVLKHPTNGRMMWFNQAHLFHVSALDPTVREGLLSMFAEDELPRNAYMGDGSPIAPEVVAEIHDAFDAETVSFPWQIGDVMLLDNMWVAHGRLPFKGERLVVVGMTDACGPGAAAVIESDVVL